MRWSPRWRWRGCAGAGATLILAAVAGVAIGADGVWRVQGVGVAGLRSPAQPLDFGNSGTGVRLMMGAVATTPITATFTGDASLRRRPIWRTGAP